MIRNTLICLCVVSSVALAELIEYHAHPKYSFEYGVNDPGTHDVKKQWETRDGDKVEGSYSFKEADGTVRIVEYHANDRTGFNAVVRREGHAEHPPTHIHTPVPTVVQSAEHHPTHVHTPVQTFVQPAEHTPIETVIHHPPSIAHHPVIRHHPEDIPAAHSYITTSVNNHYPAETVVHTPTHAEHTPAHSYVGTSVSSRYPKETVVHTAAPPPVHTVLSTSVRIPVHIPVDHETPVYTVVRNSEKVHTPTHVPEVSVHYNTHTVEHRKEPKVYQSEIAGGHSTTA